jgi:cell wall-associated NlpC family hydrolase
VTAAIIPSWATRYVGIPYKVDGADERGCDCWKLVRMVYAREAGVALPLLSDTTAQDMIETAQMVGAERASGYWLPVTGERRALDIVTMRTGRHVTHCGVMVSARHLLHVEERTDSVIVPLEHFSICRRIADTVRHVRLA